MSIDINSLQAEVSDLMMNGKPGNAGKKLGEALAYLDQSTYEPYCQILRSVLDADLDGFMEKGYNWMIQKGRKVPPEKWMEMEMVFLNRHSLVPGEQVVAAFYGGMDDKWAMYGGRIYMTNYRLILCGFKVIRSGYANSIMGLIILSIIQSVRKGVTKAIQQTLASQGGGNVVTLGYMFPTYGCYDIKRSKKNISYKIDITYEKGGKVKTETVNVGISPAKLKHEDKKQFNNETMPAILDHVSSMLNQMSSMKV